MLSLAILTIPLVLPVLYLVIRLKNAKYRNAIEKFPGPTPDFLVGNALQWGSDPADFYRQFMKWAAIYNDGAFRVWLGPKAVINIYKANYLDCVMSRSNSKKSVFYKFLGQWLQEGLLLSWGSKWQKRRKMLTPTFHYSILEDFMSVFHQHSAKLISLLQEKKNGVEFDIYPYITSCALDIICSAAMGVDLNSQELQHDYVKALHRFSELMIERIAAPWSFYDAIYSMTRPGRENAKVLKTLHDFTLKVIKARWNEYEAKLDRGEKLGGEELDIYGKKKRLAFLDLLIQNSMADQSMTINDIQEEVDTFMFEGHDTTTSAIGWSIYNLARHEEWQERIRKEIQEHTRDASLLTIKDLSEMKLLDIFLKESIRLFATVPMISREITEECQIGPYHCPKGVTVQVLISKLHRDPEYFPNPDKFDPERWLGEDITKRHPFCYVPFSSGLRNCIGQKFALLEWKIMVVNILKEFRISCDYELEDLQSQRGEMILRPTNGLPIKLHKI